MKNHLMKRAMQNGIKGLHEKAKNCFQDKGLPSYMANEKRTI